jgi:hypothetical protein
MSHLLNRPCLICFVAKESTESTSTIILTIISDIKGRRKRDFGIDAQTTDAFKQVDERVITRTDSNSGLNADITRGKLKT